MNRIIDYYITPEFDNCTVEYYLKQKGYSTKIITYIKKTENGLTVDSRKVYTNYNLKQGETLTVFLNDEAESDNIVPVNLSINIVYEDEDIVIINKAAGIPIHPSQGNYDNTLANAIMYYYKQKGEKFIFRCINRLDRNTTGLLILAKNMISACILSKMMQNREINREYRAIVSGTLDEKGTINAPIAREEGSTITRCVDFLKGESAITHYNSICNQAELTYVSIKLETGRTHQIRVHMKYLGNLLLGDSLYGGDCTRINRQALHSYKLLFTHPITNKTMEFTCPIPDDMNNLIQ